MARPAKAQNDKRTVTVRVRLTVDENARLCNYAEESGRTISDFIREKTIASPPRISKAAPDRAALIKHLGNLGRIGSNINQIAKTLNSGDMVLENHVTDALDSILALSQIIHKELGHGD